MDEPRLILIGGANGSGKTTLAREYISVEGLPYLGADQIAYELNPDDVERVAIEAGRLFIQKIAESIELNKSFIVESTLSGLSLRKWLVRAREAGFLISTSFVYLDSAELCIDRVTFAYLAADIMFRLMTSDAVTIDQIKTSGTFMPRFPTSGGCTIMPVPELFRLRPAIKVVL